MMGYVEQPIGLPHEMGYQASWLLLADDIGGLL
jgi:hypothetical protein